MTRHTHIPTRLAARRYLLAAGLALGAVGLPAFAIFAPASLQTAQIPAQPDDAVPEASDIEQAAELYRQMKQMLLDGAENDDVYGTAHDAYLRARAALESNTLDDAQTDQAKGILLDLNTTMARAAINASQKGDGAKMVQFARAYVDTQLMPQMTGAAFRRDPELYPAMVYAAASGTYNQGKLDEALGYFEEYLRTGEKKNRESVASFYGQSLLKLQQPQRGVEEVPAIANEYPANQQLLTIAMQLCIDSFRRDKLEPLLERALAFKPNDEKLLNLQAQIVEEKGDYRAALDLYTRLDELRPNSLNINEAIARCYYNLATGYYNESITATNEKDAARSRRQSNAYFSNAAEKYEELTANDPNNVKFLKAMGTAYACLGNKSKVDAVNVSLSALGQPTMAMNTMPVMMGDSKAPEGKGPRNIPSYQEYAQNFVTAEITKWAQRGEFEKVEDYKRRLSPQGIAAEQKRLSAITADNYLKEYASHLVLSELKLQPYDVENETYAVNSDFGPVYVKVPLKNHEAETFKSNWEKVQIRNAKFYIQNDAIAISNITFQMPNGKEYSYNAANALAYEPPVVNVDPTIFMQNNVTATAQAGKPAAISSKGSKKITVESDVDKNIPQSKATNTNTLALVIANEHYVKVPAVTSAEHDGDVVAQYCRETLGIPENQVFLVKDATYGNILSSINQLKNSVAAMGPMTNVILYYAGHGVPDENTKDAYMLPVDADPQVMATAYPLAKLYEELGNMGAQNVMVFMDACFSGANRGDGMLADARAVVLKPKAAAPKGNMFVLSAADGNETALPWKEKNHGLFTYWLLKKLQDSKGNASLQEIADFVSEEVRKTASLQLNKPQSPRMTVSGNLSYELGKTKLK